jgi:hypothetical protein
MQHIKQYERGCVQQKYEYGTCMTGLTVYYKKPVIGQEEIGIKMSNYSLTLTVSWAYVCSLYTMSQNVMTQSTALDTVIYSTLHTAAARKDGVHKKI